MNGYNRIQCILATAFYTKKHFYEKDHFALWFYRRLYRRC